MSELLEELELQALVMASTVAEWWRTVSEAGTPSDTKDAALRDAWATYRAVLGDVTWTNGWLSLGDVLPAYRVTAPGIGPAQEVRVRLTVSIGTEDMDLIADVLGLDDPGAPMFLDQAAALVAEYGWNPGFAPGVVRIEGAQAWAYWRGGSARGHWAFPSVDASTSAVVDAGTAGARADEAVAALASSWLSSVRAEFKRKELDGADAYWEAVRDANESSDELGALLGAVELAAWGLGVAFPLRQELTGPPTPPDALECGGHGAGRHTLKIECEAVFSIALEADLVPEIRAWLAAAAWTPPVFSDEPCHHVEVVVEEARRNEARRD